jgi:hypothetical protein
VRKTLPRGHSFLWGVIEHRVVRDTAYASFFGWRQLHTFAYVCNCG